jgi:hypothetical protein
LEPAAAGPVSVEKPRYLSVSGFLLSPFDWPRKERMPGRRIDGRIKPLIELLISPHPTHLAPTRKLISCYTASFEFHFVKHCSAFNVKINSDEIFRDKKKS